MRWRVNWPDGVVLLRLISEPSVPFFGQQLPEGVPKHLVEALKMRVARRRRWRATRIFATSQLRTRS